MAVPTGQENEEQENGQPTPIDQPCRKLRFSLRTLMLLVAVAAALSAIFAWWTRKEYRYASFGDAKACCDRKHAHSGRVLIATWGDTTGPYRRSHLGYQCSPGTGGFVKYWLDGKRHVVRFAAHDAIVLEFFENPSGNGLRLAYAKSKESLTLVSEHIE